MKQIEPISIWSNGLTKTASELYARIVDDNLSTSCTFYWTLKEADIDGHYGRILSQGNVTMDGDRYQGWDGSNDYAFDYIAGQINVTIL